MRIEKFLEITRRQFKLYGELGRRLTKDLNSELYKRFLRN